jgi:hypothetical protein
MKTRSLTPTLLLVAALSAGCAGTPPPSASAPPAAVGVQPGVEGQAGVKVTKIDGAKLTALQKAGYTLVNRNGQQLYCENDPKIGSRIVRDPTCLTEDELLKLRERTQQGLGQITTQLTPPQGK